MSLISPNFPQKKLSNFFLENPPPKRRRRKV
jgi:hypothetical protein